MYSYGVNPKSWSRCKNTTSTGKLCDHIWNETATYCFQSPSWADCQLKPVKLKEIRRQTDPRWIEVLSEVRKGVVSNETRDYLRSLERPLGDSASRLKPVALHTHHEGVDLVNQQEFNLLPGPKYSYSAGDGGFFWNGPCPIKKKLLPKTRRTLRRGLLQEAEEEDEYLWQSLPNQRVETSCNVY